MTSKKKRQRGSRTHGGGTQKNRRGAGHRGGRGNAGSRKHEMHHHGPWDKHGFTRPDDVQETVRHVLELAGIEDIWTRSSGNTRTTVNFAKATFNALQNTAEARVPQETWEKREVIE